MSLAAASFDPETNRTLAAALEQAWSVYCCEAHRELDEQETADVRDLLARRLIQMAQLEERDQSVLVADALAHLKQVHRPGG